MARGADASPVPEEPVFDLIRSVRAQMIDLLDRLIAAGPTFDPERLRELGRFLEEQGYAAAEAYRALMERRGRLEGEDRGGPE